MIHRMCISTGLYSVRHNITFGMCRHVTNKPPIWNRPPTHKKVQHELNKKNKKLCLYTIFIIFCWYRYRHNFLDTKHTD